MTAVTLDPAEAVRRHVQPGMRVLLGTGAGLAEDLIAALVDAAADLEGLHLFGGLQLGDYPFLPLVEKGWWRFDTWHVMGPIRQAVQAGIVGFHPVRGSSVCDLIRRLRPDVFLAAGTPPDDRGMVSFGASTSYARVLAEEVPVVLCEANPAMPFTEGDSAVHRDAMTALVPVERPLPTLTVPAGVDVTAAAIADNVRGLIPDGAMLQVGIGTVPHLVLESLADGPPEGLGVFGLGSDPLVTLMASAPVDLLGGELLGTADGIYAWADRNPRVRMAGAADILDPVAMARHDRFVSLNTAIEVDLTGQVNAESVAGRQISGIGGAVDFAEGAWRSRGGVPVIALAAARQGGTVSSLVPRLPVEVPVGFPRHSTRWVVTEHGAVDLLGLTVTARAEALAGIAHPDHRARLLADA